MTGCGDERRCRETRRQTFGSRWRHSGGRIKAPAAARREVCMFFYPSCSDVFFPFFFLAHSAVASSTVSGATVDLVRRDLKAKGQFEGRV